ncbi:DMT family transporter [Amycolatopsis magusensis]|uniref:Drug/metabolite transporter (DMT)-like permease n=1 Tax=Amycolatopsis magusensis TaxID=882444 RepID=A0ABS4Q3S8_9PSEU|nr:EamA family transporter [Amycolatopsis magusensis]MBP2186334.1 drug/metabolite transporter (DMT)-like permease [Amycolatopsis magusensis]
MGELLALTSALCFGVTHFANGLLSRARPGMTVSFHAQLGGTAVAVPAAFLAGGTGGGLGYGLLSGIGTGVGVAFLYRAIGRGAMSVVVPISDLGAVAIPVLAGVVLLGERFSLIAGAGVVCALAAVWLVSRTGRAERKPPPGFVDAVIAGIGFAVQFLAMARVPADAGLWPIAASRVSSVVVIAVLLLGTRQPLRIPPRPAVSAGAAGVLGSIALLLYWYATQQQLVSMATVLSALYPAIPVVLAMLFLGERVNRTQTAGLLGAVAAIVLITLG